MEISELTIRIIIILIPGVIAGLALNVLKVRHKKQSDYLFTLISIVFGLSSYLLLQVLFFIGVFVKNLICRSSGNYKLLKTLEDLANSTTTVAYVEITLACICALILAYFVTYLDNKKIVNKIARKLNVSNKYGDENTYSYFLNSQDVDWVYVRDIEKHLTYLGKVEVFSETEEIKEIVLSDVTVYNYPDSEELYRVEKIYLSYPRDKVTIEKPNFNEYAKEQQAIKTTQRRKSKKQSDKA